MTYPDIPLYEQLKSESTDKPLSSAQLDYLRRQLSVSCVGDKVKLHTYVAIIISLYCEQNNYIGVNSSAVRTTIDTNTAPPQLLNMIFKLCRILS